MPGWVPPALIILVVGVLIAALDVGRRGDQSPGTSDVHWVGGVFYFNREDRRILVPKRYGLGLGRTLNFAHPIAWAFVLVPLLVAALGSVGRN